MDIVYITGLRAEAIIGIHPWERDTRQPLVVDLELGCDTAAAARVDNIEAATDYARVSGQVLALVEGSQYQLIETLAEELAGMIMRDFAVPWLRLRLSKPGAVPQASDVGVVIERGGGR